MSIPLSLLLMIAGTYPASAQAQTRSTAPIRLPQVKAQTTPPPRNPAPASSPGTSSQAAPNGCWLQRGDGMPTQYICPRSAAGTSTSGNAMNGAASTSASPEALCAEVLSGRIKVAGPLHCFGEGANPLALTPTGSPNVHLPQGYSNSLAPGVIPSNLSGFGVGVDSFANPTPQATDPETFRASGSDAVATSMEALMNGSTAAAPSNAGGDPFAAQGSLAENASPADPVTETPSSSTWNGNQWDDPLAPDSAADNGDPFSSANAPLSLAEIDAALDSGTVNSGETSRTEVAQVADVSNWDSFANSNSNASLPSSNSLGSLANDYTVSTGSSSYSDDPPSTTVSAAPPAADHTNTLLGIELGGLAGINDAFNDNSSSKYVTDEGLKQAGSQFQQAFKVIDDAGATGISSTDANSSYNAGAVQQLNADTSNLGVASVRAILGGDYVDAATAAISHGQQTVDNVVQTIKSTARSFYSRITGAPDCSNPFLTDPECSK